MDHPRTPAYNPVNILWTGGWDSTFRVCTLVLLKRLPIQPYYMFMAGRRGSGLEFTAIQRIKRAIKEKDPSARSLILPTIVIERDELPGTPRRSKQFQLLRSRSKLGTQYEPLAVLCDRLQITDMEMSIHKDDQASHIRGHAIEVDGPTGRTYRLDPTDRDEAVQLFEHFSFPLYGISKLAMLQAATEHGFDDILKLSWFCHTPRDDTPCGNCAPCCATIEEGLAWRIPFYNRIRGYVIRSAITQGRRVRDAARNPRVAVSKLRRGLRSFRSGHAGSVDQNPKGRES